MNKEILLCLLGLILLAGCGSSDNDDIKVWMDEQSQTMRGKVDKLEPVVPYEPFIYDAVALVEPFNPAKMVVSKNNKNAAGAPDPNRQREPLEAYDLEKLVMKGTLLKNKKMVAIVETPDKSTYSVQLRSYMGQNFGVVTKISDAGIELKETIEDSSGEWVERTTTLPLQEQEQTK